MKFEYWVIGKTKEKFLLSGEEEFLKRIKNYANFKYRIFANARAGKGEVEVIKLKESDAIIAQLIPGDYLILLDENGQHYTSFEFSKKIEKLQMASFKRAIFLTGGAYGFHKKLYDRAQEKLSLSKMTFSHQMIRMFFLEQFYRAFTIINNEKYHNP